MSKKSQKKKKKKAIISVNDRTRVELEGESTSSLEECADCSGLEISCSRSAAFSACSIVEANDADLGNQ